MFISKEEKLKILNDLEYVQYQNSLFHSRIEILEKKIAQLEPKPVKSKTPKKTEEQLKVELKKARQRVYARNYYQRKKERDQVLNVGS